MEVIVPEALKDYVKCNKIFSLYSGFYDRCN